jgi:hypothetical protein
MPAKLPILLGQSSFLTPMPGANMQKNAYGIDVLSRPFSVPRNKVASAIPAQRSADIFYPNLRATGNYSVSEGEGLLCTVTVEYKGLLNNFIPDPLISTGLSTGQTSATTGDTGNPDTQRTWEIVFYSPTQTFRYITSSNPAGSKFSSVSSPIASPSILTQSITDGTGKRRADATGLSLTNHFEITTFTSNTVPGTPFFENEETWRMVYQIKPNA